MESRSRLKVVTIVKIMQIECQGGDNQNSLISHRVKK
jgi:hypothetical protein